MKPHIALVTEDVLTGIGLKSMLEDIIPFAEINRFLSLQEAYENHDKKAFFHFFISAKYYKGNPQEMDELNMHHCIIFGTKEEMVEGVHYISTDVPQEELTKSLMSLQHHAHHHYNHYPQELTQKLKQEDERKTALLTKRETEILKMVALGKSSKEIASEIHISLHTVNTHRKNIMDKLEAHSATKIMAYAVNHGYIDLEK